MSTFDGYDRAFRAVDVALPHPVDGRAVVDLPYVHFSVLLDPLRRLAAATGVNIDGAALLDVDRSDNWHLDPRVAASEQAGAELYVGNDLDRGHLVRRRDPVWGEPDVAEAANKSTFVFTNAAPQAAQFNQGRILWVGLEDHVLNYAHAQQRRINVFTGPVLAPDDPPLSRYSDSAPVLEDRCVDHSRSWRKCHAECRRLRVGSGPVARRH